jgi:hypothetical protein
MNSEAMAPTYIRPAPSPRGYGPRVFNRVHRCLPDAATGFMLTMRIPSSCIALGRRILDPPFIVKFHVPSRKLQELIC